MKLCRQCQRKYENKSAFCPYDGRELVQVDSDEDMIGRLIDNKYQIEARVARGGTGVVYRALHLQLNVSVAVKILNSDRISDATAVERFRREAYAAMQVRHPNAIAVLDFGVTSDHLVYVVMELLNGMTLRQKLKQQCYQSLIEVDNIMQQICAAVAVAHKRKIVHRDLKPENIFLHNFDGEEVVRVLDFGLAKLRDLMSDSPVLTRDGLVIGTPLYMSPEQSRGRPVDKSSDIYSLGVLLYELLTGQLPFRGPSLSALAVKHATEKPLPVYQVRPGLPALINAVVMHALEKSPKKRPGSIVEWAAELQAAIRAVTERDFRRVFLTASDHDLEAAILLAVEPGQLSAAAPLAVEIAQNASRNNEPVTNPLVNITGSNTSITNDPVNQSLDNSSDNSSELISNIDTAALSGTSPDAARLLGLAQETSAMLQDVIDDLMEPKSLDQISFSHVDAAMQSLRAAIAMTQKKVKHKRQKERRASDTL
jgi:serine/threonine-protein kinase